MERLDELLVRIQREAPNKLSTSNEIEFLEKVKCFLKKKDVMEYRKYMRKYAEIYNSKYQ